ncbi:sarcosine oxidase subunit gamma family protein [Pseudohaliea sp.]|uniref:sarcosine oxidase subunit gamma n=1 Tax=Pseudohaliea sp. TaxID=2740289 RepID=UPI0032EEBADE
MDKLATAGALTDLGLKRDRFQVAENTCLGLIRLQTFHRKAGAVENLAGRLDIRLPGPGETLSEQDRQWFWSAPGEWVIAVPAGSERDALHSFQVRLDGLLAVLSVMTDSRIILNLTGESARDILSRGSTVDFHPWAFGAGQCVNTLFAGVSVMLACPGADDVILLFVDRSVAQYLINWLEAASVDC